MDFAIRKPIVYPPEPVDAPRAIRWGGPRPMAARQLLQPIKVVRYAGVDPVGNPPIWFGPRLVDVVRRYGAARGLYRIWNAPEYRFYRSNVAPPAPGDTPYATSSTLPATPTDTFADGTWYISVTAFNGVLESGFLPLGPRGETYVRLIIAAGDVLPTKPSTPMGFRLQARPGGVVRVLAFYAAVGDGSSKADQWGLSYTTNGSTPASGAAAITRDMNASGLQVLSYDLPAQADGTVVKVQLQTMRSGTVYSDASTVASLTVDTGGPKFPQDLLAWPGSIPEGA